MLIKKDGECCRMNFLGCEIKDRNEKDENTGKWKKTGERYMEVRLLDNEGKTLEIRVKDEADFSMFDGLKRLQEVEVSLRLTVGKYINIDIIDILPWLDPEPEQPEKKK